MYVMKKTLLSLASIALAWGVFGVSYALNISDLFSNWIPLVDDAYSQILSDYDARWYSEASITNCTNTEDGIIITSPVVMDELMYEAPEYRVFVSPYRVDQLKSPNSVIDASRIVMKKVKRSWNSSEISIDLWVNDWLYPDVPYYAFILPIDEYDGVWTPSKEFCFRLDQNICMLDACDTFESMVNNVSVESADDEKNTTSEDNNSSSNGNTSSDNTSSDNTSASTEYISASENDEGMHGAACVGMNLAHVSHTVNWDKLTLTWTAVDWDEVDIAIFNPEEEIYEKLATVKMSDEKYVYTLRWNGEQNFILASNCGELRYKADAAAWQPQKDSEIKVTPATGPAENVLYIAIAAIVIYGAYVVFFRKSDNN